MVNPAERRRLIDSVKKVDFDSFLQLHQDDTPIFIFLSNLSENEREIIELNYRRRQRITRIERKDGMLCIWDGGVTDPNGQRPTFYRQFPINIP
jgi:hypothetical protein